ncbi:hypothetical protein J3F84DRAFT_374986 [Trichoderma pleuroticola]
MYSEVDPRGDTLIILQDANYHPASPSDTVKEAASENQSENQSESQSENQFLVSKKHLMLASPRAGKVLEGSFKEATPGEDGLFRWEFEPIFDPKAFEIVMKIIHGQTRYIPRKIDLALLSQITAIVDDLECHHAIWFFAKGWLNQVESLIPSKICEDLMRWMLVSFVFEEPEIFKKATTTAILYSTDVIPTFNLPIRPKVLEDMSVKRGNILSHLFALLSDVEYQLLGESIGCNKGCRAMLLGTLSQGLRSSSLSPFPSSPYVSLSISSTLQKVKAIESLDYYCEEEDITGQTSGVWILQSKPLSRGKRAQMHWLGRNDEPLPSKLGRHKCRLEDHLNRLVDTTTSEIQGLELAKYLVV